MAVSAKKKVVSGFIRPRWPKPKVVQWLEVGAVPAILGLWLPDWAGGYIAEAQGGGGFVPGFAFPPVLVFVGALILLKACWEGIRDMGWHFRALRVSGILAVVLAGLSLPAHFLRDGTTGDWWFAAEILSIGLAAFFATGFFWFTIAKVAEITVETRTEVTKIAVAVFNLAALAAGAASVLAIVLNSLLWTDLLRLTLVLFTIAFALCRYAVHCYKTQKSIGATFAAAPDEQFWV